MSSHWKVYDLLLDIVPDDAMVEDVAIGLTWTLCRSQERLGLAMSPRLGSRTLSWPGTLRGRHARDVAAWVRDWDPHKSTVGMATINATMYQDAQLVSRLFPLIPRGPANLAVFDYFRPQLMNKKVVVVGHYPGMEQALQGMDVTILERSPGASDLPDAAAEFLLQEADWVFLTSTTLINKTFPRLAELARDSNLVLMGPTTPWVAELSEFGVDYLAGVRVRDPAALQQTVLEGGGTRIFETGVEYCVADIGVREMDWIQTAISDTVARREQIKSEMEAWYARAEKGRFPRQSELVTLDAQLSSLDSQFKRLWDARH